MGIVAHMNLRLAALVVTGLVLRSLITTAYASASRALSNQQQAALAASSGVAEQCLSLIKVVRSHNTQQTESLRYGRVLDRLLRFQTRQGVFYGGSRVANGALSACILTCVIALGASLVSARALQRGELTSFVLYVGFISEASADVGDQWSKVQEVRR